MLREFNHFILFQSQSLNLDLQLLSYHFPGKLSKNNRKTLTFPESEAKTGGKHLLPCGSETKTAGKYLLPLGSEAKTAGKHSLPCGSEAKTFVGALSEIPIKQNHLF